MIAPHVLAIMGVEDPAAFFDVLCRQNYYRHVTITKDGSICVVFSFAYTDAILSDLNWCGYGDRWCFEKTYAQIKTRLALEAWMRDGTEEPTGWHRHPDTGRRIDEDGNMYINH